MILVVNTAICLFIRVQFWFAPNKLLREFISSPIEGTLAEQSGASLSLHASEDVSGPETPLPDQVGDNVFEQLRHLQTSLIESIDLINRIIRYVMLALP